MNFGEFIIDKTKKYMVITYNDNGTVTKEIIENTNNNCELKKDDIGREYDIYTMKHLYSKNKYITSVIFVDKLGDLDE